MKSDAIAIGIFAKEPVPGKVKTRLIPRLGADGAARLHVQLVEHAVVTATSAALGPVWLWLDGSPDSAFFRRLEDRYGVALRCQSAGDLGDRMAAAFAQVEKPLLVMGSDCPVIGPRLLRDCAQALRDHDAVFLPAEDGGYGLVGLQSACPRVFDAVTWGTGEVMQQTRRNLRRLNLSWCEVETIWDLDRPPDLDRLAQDTTLSAQLKAYLP